MERDLGPDSDRIASTWTVGNRTAVRAVGIRDGSIETLFEVDGAVDAMAWLPDDRLVLAMSGGDAPTSGLFLADPRSGRVEPIATGIQLLGGGVSRGLSTSADGGWVALVAAPTEAWNGMTGDLYVASTEGKLARLTNSGAARAPAWRPR
jgi:hypothetical protein